MHEYIPPKDFLAGKTILVTGAGDGIGREVSIALATHGATVVLLGRTTQKLETVYDLIEEIPLLGRRMVFNGTQVTWSSTRGESVGKEDLAE